MSSMPSEKEIEAQKGPKTEAETTLFGLCISRHFLCASAGGSSEVGRVSAGDHGRAV